MKKDHPKLSKNEPESIPYFNIYNICEGIWKIKNWFLIESDSWTRKITLLIFV